MIDTCSIKMERVLKKFFLMSNNNNNTSINNKEIEGKTREEQIAFYRDKILRTLEQDGDVDKIRSLIREQVQKSNWREEIKQMSSKMMTPDQIEELTPESISEQIREKALNSLPKNLHSNVSKHIKETLSKKQIPVENPEK